MKTYQLDELVQKIKQTVDSHRLSQEGHYARYLSQNAAGTRRMGLNEYGVADAANILYTINDFVKEPEKKAAWVSTLKGFQNPKTGLFAEPTHHPIHTTAHCIGALELFDAVPDYPLYDLEKYSTPEGLCTLFNELDWDNMPWSEAHKGAGIYAAMKLTGSVDDEWEKCYFDWLWEHEDPDSGLWLGESIKKGKAPMFHFMGGGFHYIFNIMYARRSLRYPKSLIDNCIDLYEGMKIGDKIGDYDNELFGKYIGFLEIDWVYCITRACRQTAYRFDDCRRVLSDFAEKYIEWLYSIDTQTHDGFNDLHMLFGTCCALAELQQELREKIVTRKPLQLVLDRRPFI